MQLEGFRTMVERPVKKADRPAQDASEVPTQAAETGVAKSRPQKREPGSAPILSTPGSGSSDGGGGRDGGRDGGGRGGRDGGGRDGGRDGGGRDGGGRDGGRDGGGRGGRDGGRGRRDEEDTNRAPANPAFARGPKPPKFQPPAPEPEVTEEVVAEEASADVPAEA
jgi:hypothetical protein